MASAPNSFVFFHVSSEFAHLAFEFHSSIAKIDSHIWPRSAEEIRHFAENGELLGVRQAGSGELVALCYARLDEQSNEYEVGGLTVSTEVQDLGLATVLVRFAIAYVIANERPWNYGREIIAHVHEANNDPRSLMTRIGFVHIEIVTVPATAAPGSMKRNAGGEIVGHKFRFPREATRQLLSWFETDFRNLLRDGVTPAVIEVNPGGMQSLLEALRQEVAASEGVES